MTARMDLSTTAPGGVQGDDRARQPLVAGTVADHVARPGQAACQPDNGCAYCVDSHSSDLRAAGEAEARIAAVAAWQEGPFFTPDERAALALTETMTRLSEGGDRVPDDTWATAHKTFGDEGLRQLVMVVTTINAWNRIGVSTRMVPESYAD